MKISFVLTVAILGTALLPMTLAAEPTVSQLWQTEAGLKVPESVRYDAQRQVLYVSNVDGENPWALDGKGSISKVGLDGTILELDWISGMDGPKGMAINGNFLYVTDIDDVVTIDIDKGQIVDRIAVPNAEKINDLSVGSDGTIYITDSKIGSIYKLVNKEFTTLVTDIPKLNGVLHSQGDLFFLSDGGLYIAGENGAHTKIADGMEGATDGVERIDDDSWLVSCWKGTVYHVTRSGEVTLLLDGRDDGISAADLGYDPVNRIAYFPGFWKNTVAAYQLN